MRIGMDARHAKAGLGIATYVHSLTCALVHSGAAEVVWIGPAEGAPDGTEPCGSSVAPYPLLDGPLGRRQARRQGLDVMHFTGNTGWRGRGPVPVVLTVHDLIFFERRPERSARQRCGHAYVRWNIPAAASAASRLTAVSETTAGAVERRLGRRPMVIPHGVGFPGRPGTPADPPYLMAFGGRDPRKGLELALEVARATGLPLHVAARAGLPEGFDRETADERATNRVVLHRSLVRADLDALLAGALAVLYLSRDEGFGLPVIEAMAAGTPVVTGNAPATREVAETAGLLIDPDDVLGSAVAHVRAVANHPERRAAAVAAGRLVAEGRSWSAVAERYAEVYREVVEL